MGSGPGSGAPAGALAWGHSNETRTTVPRTARPGVPPRPAPPLCPGRGPQKQRGRGPDLQFQGRSGAERPLVPPLPQIRSPFSILGKMRSWFFLMGPKNSRGAFAGDAFENYLPPAFSCSSLGCGRNTLSTHMNYKSSFCKIQNFY